MADEDDDKAHCQTIKTSLKSVALNDSVIEKLAEAALRMNKIAIHTLQFTKLFLLHQAVETRLPLPKLSRLFFRNVAKTICVRTGTGPRASDNTVTLREALDTFHTDHYRHLMQEECVASTNLHTAIEYLAQDILVMYKNNVQQNYWKYVKSYVDVMHDKRQQITAIKATDATPDAQNIQIRAFLDELAHVFDDIFKRQRDDQLKTSPRHYHDFINERINYLTPNRDIVENNMAYDIKVKDNWQDYLLPMIKMTKVTPNAV
jgi:hypothetical protein